MVLVELSPNITILVSDRYPIELRYKDLKPYDFGDYSFTKEIVFIYNIEDGDNHQGNILEFSENINGIVTIDVFADYISVYSISVPIEDARYFLEIFNKIATKQARETRVEYGPLAHSAAAARKTRKSRKARKN
jgi:hypothetical protein